MDEAAQVYAPTTRRRGRDDVSGVLRGDLSSRLVAQVRTRGPDNTFTGRATGQWVDLRERHADRLRRLAPSGGSRSGAGGTLERYYVRPVGQGTFAFTGTWGTRTDSTGQLNAGTR
jgi:hypothetical protein